MIRCLFILLLLAPLQERPDYPLKNGRPTSKGIDRYIEENAYIYTEDLSKKSDHMEVDRAFQSFFAIYSNREVPGSRFIEEGICEYVTLKMNETISQRRPYIPKKPSDLFRKENAYNIYYKYSAYCLTEFLDTTGLKRGVKILLHNRPPSTEEILKPDLFFKRLEGIPQM
ncbi:MAG: hypothetical protein K8R52_00660 [Bacteroidales bacterium]|nr:hypothetical protein [Bacteroidales bacterium]